MIREAEAVLADVERGFLTIEKAHDAYGVVIGDGRSLQVSDTQKRRKRLRGQRPSEPPIFDFGTSG